MTFQKKLNPRFLLLVAFMLLVAILRITGAAQAMPLSNFTPIGAMGLFGGAYFNQKWKAFSFPLITLFISDIIINVFIYDGQYGIMYASWYWVYGGFCMIVLLGQWLLKKITITRIATTAIMASVLYWLIVDFGVFLVGCTNITTGEVMDHSFTSLMQCYAQGLPYMKNFLGGTLLYSALLFGTYEWMKFKSPSQKTASA